MKIYLVNQADFSKEVIDFYKENFEIVKTKKDADIIVINSFKRINTKKIVACNSTGIEHIKAKELISLRGEDLSELTAVPELCLGMAIYSMRIFKKEEIKGKTLGIIGMGRIGKKFAEYASLLGMKVIGYDKNKGNLENLLKESDIVSIHITSDQKNAGFFSSVKFEMMKEGAILLNSARPWLVDYQYLKLALDNKLSGAWFDFQLPFEHPKLLTTPHLGGTTKESKKVSEMIIAKRLYEIKQKNRKTNSPKNRNK